MINTFEQPVLEAFKEMIAKVDYYLDKGDITKLNNELNIACKYILMKEGKCKFNEDATMDILDGFKKKKVPDVRFGRDDNEEEKLIPIIPNKRYDAHSR
jgi:hypothetical protein